VIGTRFVMTPMVSPTERKAIATPDQAGARPSDILTSQMREGLLRPINEARGLPAEAYTSRDLWELEKASVFRGGWVAVAFQHQIAHPGDAIPIEVVGVPLILLRDHDLSVRGFLNICRHRGAKILSKVVRNKKAFTCPYHAWSYGLDGCLKHTPLYDGTRSRNTSVMPPSDANLLPVRTACWLDMIFVSISDGGADFENHVRPLEPLWECYQPNRLSVFHYEMGTIRGNWKLAVEAAVDTYHEGFVHRSLSHRIREDGSSPFEDVGSGAMFGISWQGESSLRSEIPMAPLQIGFQEHDRRDSLCFLFPNAQFNMFGGLSVRTVWMPIAPDCTEWRSSWYMIDEWANDRRREGAREAIINNWREIREEDREIIELLQLGRMSPIVPYVRFAPFWEKTALRFQRLWADCMTYGHAQSEQ
jgi:phenylpropionate dioxygenase-like ring-hydroxylating dioxygenase large terminal subunit